MTDPKIAHEDDALTRALRPLARLLAPLVADELTKSGGTEDVYSVARPLPGQSPRWMRTHLRHMPGAYQDERGRWFIRRADALAYLATLTEARRARRTTTKAKVAPSNVVDVAEWISAAGFRRTSRTA